MLRIHFEFDSFGVEATKHRVAPDGCMPDHCGFWLDLHCLRTYRIASDRMNRTVYVNVRTKVPLIFFVALVQAVL